LGGGRAFGASTRLPAVGALALRGLLKSPPQLRPHGPAILRASLLNPYRQSTLAGVPSFCT
jgi:hypothetical protein